MHPTACSSCPAGRPAGAAGGSGGGGGSACPGRGGKGLGPPARAGRTGEAAYRAALEAPFQAYARMHGAPGWGDKTPYYVGHIGEPRRVFPEARIVNVAPGGR